MMAFGLPRPTCQKKVGQIYINIPGRGSMNVVENPKRVGNLNSALEKAWTVFLEEYERLQTGNKI